MSGGSVLHSYHAGRPSLVLIAAAVKGYMVGEQKDSVGINTNVSINVQQQNPNRTHACVAQVQRFPYMDTMHTPMRAHVHAAPIPVAARSPRLSSVNAVSQSFSKPK